MHFWIDKRIPGYGYNPNPRYGPHSCVTGFRRNPHSHRHTSSHSVESPSCHTHHEHLHTTADNNARNNRQASNSARISISSIEANHGNIDNAAHQQNANANSIQVNEESLIVRPQNTERCSNLKKLNFGFWLTVALFMFLFTIFKNYTGLHIMGFGMIALLIFIPLLIITGVISIYKGISRMVSNDAPHSFIGYDGEAVVGVPVIRVTYVTEPTGGSGVGTTTPSIEEQPPPPYDEAIKYPTRASVADTVAAQKALADNTSPPPYDKAVT